MPAKSAVPRWYSIPLRVLLVTFIGTLLCFAVILLLALIATIVLARLHGVHPDMTIAYRQIAFPSAAVAGSIIFLLISGAEIRHYRQRKALEGIERVS